MNRLIKYRGYSKHYEQWVDVDSKSVGQYIGREDKNGLDICEGDILTSTEYPFQSEGEYNYHGIVEYSEELAAFIIVKRVVNPKRAGISDRISDYFEGRESLEVIGNCYENQDLLEGVENAEN